MARPPLLKSVCENEPAETRAAKLLTATRIFSGAFFVIKQPRAAEAWRNTMHGPFLLRLVACSAVCTASFVISETGLGAFFEPNSKAQSPSPHSSASDGTLLEPVKSDYYYYFDRRASILSRSEEHTSELQSRRDLV